MDAQAFQSKLRKTFDKRLSVEVDRRDGCMVVFDKTRSGAPYVVRKISATAVAPHQRGVSRDAYEKDVSWLHKRNWAEKYNQRSGAAKQIVDQTYRRPQAYAKLAQAEAISEVARGPAKDYAEWRCGNKNVLSMAPVKDGGAGGQKNRHQDEKRARGRRA